MGLTGRSKERRKAEVASSQAQLASQRNMISNVGSMLASYDQFLGSSRARAATRGMRPDSPSWRASMEAIETKVGDAFLKDFQAMRESLGTYIDPKEGKEGRDHIARLGYEHHPHEAVDQQYILHDPWGNQSRMRRTTNPAWTQWQKKYKPDEWFDSLSPEDVAFYKDQATFFEDKAHGVSYKKGRKDQPMKSVKWVDDENFTTKQSNFAGADKFMSKFGDHLRSNRDVVSVKSIRDYFGSADISYHGDKSGGGRLYGTNISDSYQLGYGEGSKPVKTMKELIDRQKEQEVQR